MKKMMSNKLKPVKKKYKQTIKPFVKWRRRIKGVKIIKKVFGIIIVILGPAMSIFLTVDGFLNKDKA